LGPKTTWHNAICLKPATYVASPLKKLQRTNFQSNRWGTNSHTHTHTPFLSLFQSLCIKLPEAGSPAGGSDLRKHTAVAPPSGQQQQSNHSNLSRRRTAPSSNSSPSRPSAPTRIIYRETLGPSSFSESDLDLPFWQRTWFIGILLVMALSFFGLAIFLFLTLDSDYNTSPVYAATSEGVEITYGSVLKLMHEKTRFRLHSHDVPYGSGSGQQSVTGFPNVDDANSYWIVRPMPETSAKQGDGIKSGTIIRLQHMKTRRWLHSHLHASPISGNLEVSCFGDDGNSDTGDYWRLEIEGSGKTWRQDQRIRLRHVDTSGYLHSHDKKYNRIAGGQQEVCGVREKRADNVWLVVEGVFLPVSKSK
ncbi:Glycosyltransferase 39 like protein, partial [Cynara cardunculus var. scolymus]